MSTLELAQEKAEAAINTTNEKIEVLGQHANALHDSLTELQATFDLIRNVPSEAREKHEKYKAIRTNWKIWLFWVYDF